MVRFYRIEIGYYYYYYYYYCYYYLFLLLPPIFQSHICFIGLFVVFNYFIIAHFSSYWLVDVLCISPYDRWLSHHGVFQVWRSVYFTRLYAYASVCACIICLFIAHNIVWINQVFLIVCPSCFVCRQATKTLCMAVLVRILPKSSDSPSKRYSVVVPTKFLTYTVR